MADNTLTQAHLKSIFDYENGNLLWKNRTTDSIGRDKSHLNGKIAGTLDKNGYLKIRINNKNYLIHRLIYLYHYGHLPKVLDHIDGNPLNNNIKNLREATFSQNQHNSKIYKTNTSGIKGVCWHKATKKWIVHIQTKEKRHFLGYFDELDKAKVAIIKARENLHGEFARHL